MAATDEWDDPMEVMSVSPSWSDSCERVMHDVRTPSCLPNLRNLDVDMEPRLQRFIGIIYQLDTER